MTSIQDNIVKTRVLVDWDNDGFFNVGVPVGTPANLFPASICPIRSNVAGYKNNVFGNYTVVPDFTERGSYKRYVELGHNANDIRMLFDDYHPYQKPNDYNGAALNPNKAPVRMCFGELEATVKQTKATPYAGYTIDGAIPTTNPYQKDISGDFVGKYCFAISPTASMNATVWAIGYGGAQYYAATQYDANYTQAVNSAASFGGIPVSGSKTYTLKYYYYIPDKGSTILGAALNEYVYTDGGSASSPNYGRQIAGKGTPVGNPTTNTWGYRTVTVTTPANATKLALDIQYIVSTGTAPTIFFGGLSIVEGASYTYYDSGVVYTADQFTFTDPPKVGGQDYVLSYWVRSPDGMTKLKPKFHKVTIGDTAVTDTTLSDITVTSTWTRVNHAINIPDHYAAGTQVGFWLTFTGEKNGVTVDNDGVRCTAEFSGFMLTQGTITDYPYHTGEFWGYDDITDYVLSANTVNGKKSFSSSVPDEGTATLMLNNASKIFSPANTDSPLYGYLNPNLKIAIQAYDGTNWQTLWIGWTEKFKVATGLNRDVRAELFCQQGVYRLAEGTLRTPTQQNTTIDQIVPELIENSGFRSAALAETAAVGMNTKVQNNAHVLDTTNMFRLVETGINTIELAGRDWSKQTDPRKALDELLGAENAQMWINRDGTISIVNRNHWITTAVSDSVVLGVDAVEADYDYGQDVINAVDVKVSRNKLTSSSTVWETRRAIKMIPNQVWTAELNPEYTEGRIRTVINYTLDGMTKNVYIRDTGITNDTTATASTDQANAVTVTLVGEAGVNPKVKIRNTNGIPVWVHLSIKGSYATTGDSEVVTVEDETSIDQLQGRHSVTYANPVISDTVQAETYGEYLILRQATPEGDFKSFTVIVRNQDDLDRIMALSLGSIIAISEKQVVETTLSHIIIGEDIAINNNRELAVTYHTTRTLQENFANADSTTVAKTSLNEVDDMYTAEVMGGGGSVTTVSGEAYGTERAIVWDTGHAPIAMCILHPADGQVQILKPTYGASLWPATDASGNAFAPQSYIEHYQNEIDAAFFPTWIMPTGNDQILWYGKTRLGMTATGTCFATFKSRRDKTTDEAVGNAATYEHTISVTPDAYYQALNFGILRDPSQLPAGANPSGQVLEIIDKTGTVLTSPAGSFSLTVSSLTSGSMPIIGKTFRARTNGGTPIHAVGYKPYKKTKYFEAEGFMRGELLRVSKNKGVNGSIMLEAGTTYTLALYVVSGDGIQRTATMYLIDDADGATIGSTGITATANLGVVSHITFTAPASGCVWVYLQDVTLGQYSSVFVIPAWGIVEGSSVPTLAQLTDKLTTEVVYA